MLHLICIIPLAIFIACMTWLSKNALSIHYNMAIFNFRFLHFPYLVTSRSYSIKIAISTRIGISGDSRLPVIRSGIKKACNLKGKWSKMSVFSVIGDTSTKRYIGLSIWSRNCS